MKIIKGTEEHPEIVIVGDSQVTIIYTSEDFDNLTTNMWLKKDQYDEYLKAESKPFRWLDYEEWRRLGYRTTSKGIW